MESNPYTTPVVSGERNDLFAGSGLVSGAAIQQLAGTKPWVRLLSVISFIGSGFMLLGAGSLVLMGTIGSFVAAGNSGSVLPASFGIGIAIAYAVFAVIYLYPGVKLWKYANAIALLMQTQSEVDLVKALDQQRAFWKFLGILVAIVIGLYIIAMVLMVVGVAGAAAFAR